MALGIVITEVASVEPPFAERSTRRVGVSKIPSRDLCAANRHFSNLSLLHRSSLFIADDYLQSGGDANRATFAAAERLNGDGRRFGHPVDVNQGSLEVRFQFGGKMRSEEHTSEL